MHGLLACVVWEPVASTCRRACYGCQKRLEARYHSP